MFFFKQQKNKEFQPFKIETPTIFYCTAKIRQKNQFAKSEPKLFAT